MFVLSVCLLVTSVYCGKTADSFGIVGPSNHHVLDGGPDLSLETEFFSGGGCSTMLHIMNAALSGQRFRTDRAAVWDGE